jgi:hypothetical protein
VRWSRNVASALRAFARVDGALYVLWAATLTILSARSFYGYMLRQTGGVWSAPLDDVFIHFDFARSTAQGYPFEWTVGNGYSSGNTSLSYPFVLALGWIFGFRELDLMKFAALVAMLSVFGVLLATRRMFLRIVERGREQGAMRVLSFGLPVVFLGLGALDWSLWSGMEVAFFLGVWACTLLAFFRLEDAQPHERSRRAYVLGLWGAFLVTTRPEAASTIAIFGLFAALRGRRPLRLPDRVAILTRAGGPAIAVLLVQALANRHYTGEFSPNGALVKLAVNNPFLTPTEKYGDWQFNLTYTVFRNIEYHFTDDNHYSALVPALAIAALCVRETRRYAAMLWLQIVGWLVIVALNGQVRWQNERYTMPAVAWLLCCAVLGAAALLKRSGRPRLVATVLGGALVAQIVGIAFRIPNAMPEFRIAWPIALAMGLGGWLALRYWPMRAALVLATLTIAEIHQGPRMRDQRWFFGRACRNIYDQHIVTGQKLAALRPRRILVGDAGAILYASERPGLDIIGLGGYHDYPFARAGVQGLPATLELIERMPAADRPDVMAIYPSWWGVLPTWFAKDELFRTPAEGNVICGGYEDVVYSTDWHVLGTGARPRVTLRGPIVDEVDVADLVSEREHQYQFPRPGGGWTEMRILADPADSTLDLFDSGRRISFARSEVFHLHGLNPGAPYDLALRTASTETMHVKLYQNGTYVGDAAFTPEDGWVERVITMPAPTTPDPEVRIESDGPSDFIDYHVWVAQ